jgi:hypothetical protein
MFSLKQLERAEPLAANLDLNSGQLVTERILLLTSSLLVDRVFIYTGFLDRLTQLGRPIVWATSSIRQWPERLTSIGCKIEGFPTVDAYRELPHNYLRRLNEFVWDYRFNNPSRISVRRYVRDKQQRLRIRALKGPAMVLASLKAESWLENNLERMLLDYERSPEALRRLAEMNPSVVLTTGPFQFEQPGVVAAARRLGIPVVAYIPSWDNISTKNRMVFKYDGYIVWNERTKQELLETYPHARSAPIYKIGAPQFDVFHQERFYLSRDSFCRSQGLDPELPIIVYAIGSPNFLKEHHGAVYLAKRVVEGKLGNVQMLVRPHPIHDNSEMKDLFDQFSPRVRLQKTANAGLEVNERSQDHEQIVEWVNTFKHADVVVNLSSTVTIDAAIFDKPVVNLNFDPQPDKSDQALIKDVNTLWTHFSPIAQSGGVWLVNDWAELETAINTYLKDPSLHREKRKWIVQRVCGFSDGKCGVRFAEAIVDFLQSKRRSYSVN